MQIAAAVRFSATLKVEHRRNGVLLEERFLGPREPLALRKIKDPWVKETVGRTLLQELFDPWVRQAKELIFRKPVNVVTTAGVDYLASNFAGTGNMDNFKYHDCGTGKDSQVDTSVTITAASNATPIVITNSGSNGFTTNDLVTVVSVGGNTAANGDWQVTVTNSTSFTLIGSVGNGAYTSGGTCGRLNGAGDTTLVTPFGGSRVAGTATNPSANQYQSVATLSQSTGFPYSIVEWGLFSASSSGILWDRRWLNTANAPSTTATGSLTSAPITLTSSSDTITFTYVLSCNPGGS